MVLFAACSKDDDNAPQTNKKYVLSIAYSSDSLEISYDDNNRMKKIRDWYLEQDYIDSSELVYENGKLTKLTSNNSEGVMKLSQSFEYNNAGKLMRVNSYNSIGERHNYDSLVYNNDGRLVALYEAAADGYMRKHNYTWDSKGNIVSSVRINIAEGVETKDSAFTVYTYDSKVNFGSRQPEFFTLEPKEPASWLSANNLVKSVETNNTDRSYAMTVTNEYTYDADGYPVTRKELEKSVRGEEVVYSHEDTFRYRYIMK